MKNLGRLVISVLISVVISFLPLFFPSASFLRFLSLPGAMVAFLFGAGVRDVSEPARVVSNLIVWSIALYFGPELWKWGQSNPTRQTPPAAKAVFVFWLVLLLPWLLVAPLSGMAFDAGYTSEAYALVWSVWTYPISVGVTAVFRRWVPWLVLLPLLNVAGCCASGLLHK